jgi:hypothetical protein
MKLNGWYRLWILLSTIYFILVTSYVILEFPKAENIPHQSEFYKKLSKKSAGMISSNNLEDALALGHEITTDFTPVKEEEENVKPIDFHPIIEMPNKHTIEFNAKLSEEDMKIASQEYWRIVEQKASEKRHHLLLYAFLFWIFPCIALYALGWSINWVYKGFKQKKDAQQIHPADPE